MSTCLRSGSMRKGVYLVPRGRVCTVVHARAAGVIDAGIARSCARESAALLSVLALHHAEVAVPAHALVIARLQGALAHGTALARLREAALAASAATPRLGGPAVVCRMRRIHRGLRRVVLVEVEGAGRRFERDDRREHERELGPPDHQDPLSPAHPGETTRPVLWTGAPLGIDSTNSVTPAPTPRTPSTRPTFATVSWVLPEEISPALLEGHGPPPHAPFRSLYVEFAMAPKM